MIDRRSNLLVTLACLAAANASAESIRVQPGMRFQTMEGFGASLTESSAVVLNRMSVPQRNALMSSLFNPTSGAGLSFLRQPIGASDYASSYYSLDDMPAGQTDFTLTHFSAARETTTITPLLQSAQTLNPNLRLMGTPWSAPGWMKTNGSMVAGKLINSTTIYNTYADYFVKYIQAQQAQGLTMNYVSLQNEPWLQTNYPSMQMEPAEAARLAKALAPKLAAAGLNTKILAFDHNWDIASSYISQFMSDTQAGNVVDGFAMHGYSGDVAVQSQIQSAYPTKGIYFTELTGVFGSNFASDLMSDMRNLIVGGTRNAAKTIVRWNLALDENGAPYINGPTSLCRGLVTVNSSTGAVTYNEEFYSLSHLSRFVQPGAQRVDTDSDHSVAFLNPNGSTAMVAYNDASSTKPIVIHWNGKFARYTLPAQSAATFTWTNSSSVSLWVTTGDKSKLLSRQADIAFDVTRYSANRLGSWFDASLWSVAVPNGIDDAATLTSGNTAARTVYADQPLTLAQLTFDSPNPYNLVGAASLTIQGSQTLAKIDVAQGNHTINLPLTIASDTTLNVNAGSTLRIADPVTINADRTLTRTGGGSVVFDSTVTVLAASSLVMAGDVRTTASLSALSLREDASIDLGSAAIVGDAVIADQLKRLLASDRLTSTSLEASGGGGVLLLFDAPAGGLTLNGVSIDAGRFVSVAALTGDVNLDGLVDDADLAVVVAHLDQATSSAGWMNGDVTQDGVVDFRDYSATAANLGRSILPEPSAMLGAAFVTLLPRRRRLSRFRE